MLKKILIFGLFVMFTLGTLAFAEEEGPGGNKRKGKYTYKKVVQACFERGEVDSDVPKISPADKKQAEWKGIFEGKNFAEFGCAQEWAALSEEDVLDIYSYMYNYAADSPAPATCK